MKINCPQKKFDKDYKKFVFPAGEPHIILSHEVTANILEEKISIEFNFSKSEDIVELLLLAHTLKINRLKITQLDISYMPFGQADRVNEYGECFSLKMFCELINNFVQPEWVTVYDPHSDVTPALLNNCYIYGQEKILFPILRKFINNENIDQYKLVSPDAGSSKKIFKVNQFLKCQIIQCEKVRNTFTGEITGTKVYCDEDLKGCNCVIIDDICVGGKTFIEIAKILRERNSGKIYLVTTHGIYSKGLSVFEGLIDEIYNKGGRVK